MAKSKCSGDSGRCPKDVFAKGLCIGHYNRLRRGGDVDKPVREFQKDEVQFTPPRASKAIKRAVKAVCAHEGISEYEFMRRLLEEWYARYERLVPGAASRTDGRDARSS